LLGYGLGHKRHWGKNLNERIQEKGPDGAVEFGKPESHKV